MFYVDVAKDSMEKSLDAMKKRFINVRAGRANPAILDDVMVSYYGTLTPLKSLATISIPEARTLSIKPFDKGSLGLIEKAIYEANIGITPNNNGETIMLNIPPLTEDRRKELVKQVRSIAEEAKIALRNIRQTAKDDIKKEELPEDEENKQIDKIQELINEFNKKVEDELKEKEEELMTV